MGASKKPKDGAILSMISAITTCKGRLDDLRFSLPTMIEHADEVIVVDYGCPDGTHKYVSMHYPGVKCIQVKGRRYFNLSHARNIGAKASSSDILLFIDADVGMGEGFRERIIETFNATDITGFSCGYIMGTAAIRRSIFFEVKGYNEKVEDWGWEDQDLEERCMMLGEFWHWDTSWIDLVIPFNNNADKSRFYKTKSILESNTRNELMTRAHRKEHGHIGNLREWGAL